VLEREALDVLEAGAARRIGADLIEELDRVIDLVDRVDRCDVRDRRVDVTRVEPAWISAATPLLLSPVEIQRPGNSPRKASTKWWWSAAACSIDRSFQSVGSGTDAPKNRCSTASWLAPSSSVGS
jgi:hypothetical protein